MDPHGDMYAPRFASHRGTPLKWDYKINIVGRRDPDPKIYNCEKCSFPIKTFGRMIPCKHVFCFDCAKATDKSCLRCEDPVQRIEQSPLGSIFLCSHGAPKHDHDGCRRTYLSQRDLEAHIGHRHKKLQSQVSSSSLGNKDLGHGMMSRMADSRPDPRGDSRVDPRSHQPYAPSRQEAYPNQPPAQGAHIMPERMQYDPCPLDGAGGQAGPDDYHVNVPVRKSNLITVPLHDSSKNYQQAPPQGHGGVPPQYQTQAPIVAVQQQHQAPPPPPPPQHVSYAQHLTPVSVAHVAPISHPPPVSGAYTGPPISVHQVMHPMHPPPSPIYSQPSVPPPPMNPPHFDTTPRAPFPANNPIPAPNPPFPAPGVPLSRSSWPVGPPPPTSNMPPPLPQTSMPPPPPPSQVSPMGNPVPSMPPPQAPGQRPEMGPPPPPMGPPGPPGPPMNDGPRYHGQYFSRV